MGSGCGSKVNPCNTKTFDNLAIIDLSLDYDKERTGTGAGTDAKICPFFFALPHKTFHR
jgi:hypothetical protein